MDHYSQILLLLAANVFVDRSFQGYPPDDPWSFPEPKHVIFEGSLDRIISKINTSCGAFLIKAGENGMFVDNRLLPRLNVAAYKGEISAPRRHRLHGLQVA